VHGGFHWTIPRTYGRWGPIQPKHTFWSSSHIPSQQSVCLGNQSLFDECPAHSLSRHVCLSFWSHHALTRARLSCQSPGAPMRASKRGQRSLKQARVCVVGACCRPVRGGCGQLWDAAGAVLLPGGVHGAGDAIQWRPRSQQYARLAAFTDTPPPQSCPACKENRAGLPGI
jgi:hypothetical protein